MFLVNLGHLQTCICSYGMRICSCGMYKYLIYTEWLHSLVPSCWFIWYFYSFFTSIFIYLFSLTSEYQCVCVCAIQKSAKIYIFYKDRKCFFLSVLGSSPGSGSSLRAAVSTVDGGATMCSAGGLWAEPVSSGSSSDWSDVSVWLWVDDVWGRDTHRKEGHVTFVDSCQLESFCPQENNKNK